jgi:hypothetical protein
MMLVHHLIAASGWMVGFSLVAAALTPMNSNLQIRNARDTSSTETLRKFRRVLSAAVLKRDTDKDTFFRNSTSLDTSWDGSVLFSVSGYVHVI